MLAVLAVFSSPTTEWIRVREHLRDAQTLSSALGVQEACAIGLDPYVSSNCLVDDGIDDLIVRVTTHASSLREALTRAVEQDVRASREDSWVLPLVERALLEDESMQRFDAVAAVLRAARERHGVVVLLGD